MIAQLREGNDDLRKLVVQLGEIVLSILVEPSGPLQPGCPEAPAKLLEEMSPAEIIERLRGVAIDYARLSRNIADRRGAQSLEGLSVQLADVAAGLAAEFGVSHDGSTSAPKRELTGGTRRNLNLSGRYALDDANRPDNPPKQPPALTAREREVLTWIAAGKSAWEIGEILGIAKRTVDEHAHTAVHKLDAANRTQAVVIAIRNRLIEI